MTERPHAGGRDRGIGAALLVLVCLTVASCGTPSSVATAPTPSPTPEAVSTSAAPTAIAPSPATPDRGAPPTRLQIPDIDVDSSVDPVGTVDRVLQIPPKPWVVGWWKDGVGVGADRGTVVLVAHLDSRTYGAGPFVRAKDLEPGATAVLQVGAVAERYRVASVDTYLKRKLPYEQLFAQSGPPRVVLVTCGGEYHRDGTGWDSNVVVTFVPATS